jgi:hypothetical protein
MSLSQSKLLDHHLQFTLTVMTSNTRESLCESVGSRLGSENKKKKLARKLSAESASRRS